MSIGTIAMIARYFGAKDFIQANAAAVQSLILGGVISVALFFFGITLDKPVLIGLGATPEMMAPASASGSTSL
jgi:Na+-driven multidrug efflux pump